MTDDDWKGEAKIRALPTIHERKMTTLSNAQSIKAKIALRDGTNPSKVKRTPWVREIHADSQRHK